MLFNLELDVDVLYYRIDNNHILFVTLKQFSDQWQFYLFFIFQYEIYRLYFQRLHVDDSLYFIVIIGMSQPLSHQSGYRRLAFKEFRIERAFI